MRQLLNFPNLLTLSRLVMTPFVVAAVLGGSYRLALAIFLVAGITDALDGPAARKWHATTRVGAYLDPIADKILLVAVYLSLGIVGLLPVWLVVLILGRDVLLLASVGALLILTPHREFLPSGWGKLSTFAQIATAVTAITAQAIASPMLERWVGILIWGAAAATLWSGLHYAWRARRFFRATAADGAR